MSEKPPRPESAPQKDPYDTFESLVGEGQWTSETEARLAALLESHEEDLYMIYLNYRESGLVDELPEHERQMYEWLKNQFDEIPD